MVPIIHLLLSLACITVTFEDFLIYLPVAKKFSLGTQKIVNKGHFLGRWDCRNLFVSLHYVYQTVYFVCTFMKWKEYKFCNQVILWGIGTSLRRTVLKVKDIGTNQFPKEALMFALHEIIPLVVQLYANFSYFVLPQNYKSIKGLWL